MSISETIEDKTVEFILTRDETIRPPSLESLIPSVPTEYTRMHWRDGYDEEQAELRTSLWGLKTELDPIEDKQYLEIRTRLFPLARTGQQSRYFFNRAGFKLMESMEATGVWVHLKQITKPHKKKGRRVAFVDVCGGPGAFSQALFAVSRKQQIRLKGFGITLTGVPGLDWYPELIQKGFVPSYGVDGTGDVFNLANLNALATVTADENVLLVVADGGFTVEKEEANFQETISARITFGQWLAALKLLRPGGCLVLKLFDTFSPNTRAFLYLSTFLFQKVHIVKPLHSRVVNSERYLVGVNLGVVPEGWMRYWESYYRDGFVDNDHSPLLIPQEVMSRDKVFMDSIRDMNRTLAENQMVALRMIVKAHKEGLSSAEGDNNSGVKRPRSEEKEEEEG